MYLPGQSPGDTPHYFDNRLTNIKTKNISTFKGIEVLSIDFSLYDDTPRDTGANSFLFNKDIFKKIGFSMTKKELEDVVNSKPKAIENILWKLYNKVVLKGKKTTKSPTEEILEEEL